LARRAGEDREELECGKPESAPVDATLWTLDFAVRYDRIGQCADRVVDQRLPVTQLPVHPVAAADERDQLGDDHAGEDDCGERHSVSSSRSNGLRMTAESGSPASAARRSPASYSTRKTIRTDAAAGLARSSCTSSTPDRPGRTSSTIRRSGTSASIACHAS